MSHQKFRGSASYHRDQSHDTDWQSLGAREENANN